MNVLHLISSGGMYGAEAVILNLSSELNASGVHRSALGVFAHPNQPSPKVYDIARGRGIEAHLVACRGQADRTVPATFRALAKQVGADVVHTHGYKADIYAALAWRRERPVLVSTCHTWYDNDLTLRAYGAADRWVLRRFDGVVAVSEEVRARLLRARVHPERIRLIRNGVPAPPPAGANAVSAEKARGAVRVGLVGRLAPEKGIDLFLEAASELRQRHPQVHFLIAGDGPDRAALDLQVKQLGLGEQVTFTGRQDNIAAFYASLDVLVSSSRQEGLPMALLEGMASGLPVVATRVGAVPEIVVDGVTGFVVPAGEPFTLAAAIDRLLADSELRLRLGRAGQQRAHEEFSAGRMTADYLAFYDGAIEKRTGLANLRTCPS